MSDEHASISPQAEALQTLGYFDSKTERPPLLRPMLALLFVVFALEVMRFVLQRLDDYLVSRQRSKVLFPSGWTGDLLFYLDALEPYYYAFLACSALACLRRKSTFHVVFVAALVVLIGADFFQTVAALVDWPPSPTGFVRSAHWILLVMERELLPAAGLWVLLRHDVRDYYHRAGAAA
jgi:hypothetical protein